MSRVVFRGLESRAAGNISTGNKTGYFRISANGYENTSVTGYAVQQKRV